MEAPVADSASASSWRYQTVEPPHKLTAYDGSGVRCRTATGIVSSLPPCRRSAPSGGPAPPVPGWTGPRGRHSPSPRRSWRPPAVWGRSWSCRVRSAGAGSGLRGRRIRPPRVYDSTAPSVESHRQQAHTNMYIRHILCPAYKSRTGQTLQRTRAHQVLR